MDNRLEGRNAEAGKTAGGVLCLSRRRAGGTWTKVVVEEERGPSAEMVVAPVGSLNCLLLYIGRVLNCPGICWLSGSYPLTEEVGICWSKWMEQVQTALTVAFSL